MAAVPQSASSPQGDPLVTVARDGGVVRLTLNRPAQFNALSEDLMRAVQAELERVAVDPSARVVVIGGAGKAFCAGHDLREMRANPSHDYYRALFAQCAQMMVTIQQRRERLNRQITRQNQARPMVYSGSSERRSFCGRALRNQT